MKLKALLIFGVAVLSTFFSKADIFTVTNPNGNVWWPATGEDGSFQRAIADAAANPGRDTIEFAVPGGVVSASKDPLPFAVGEGDVFVNGFSTIDGSSTTITFSITVAATDVEFYGLNFTTVNSSIEITGNSNTVDSCSFAVTGGGQNGVWIRGGNGSTVNRCLFTASQQHAVSIEVGGSHTVTNCLADGINDVAFIARGTGNNLFADCIARNGNHNGFGMLCGDNTVEDCISYDNARSGIAVDNSLGTGSGNIIRRNVVYGNNTNFYMGSGKPLYDQGAIFSNGPDTEIYDNIIYDNEANGIMINSAFATNTVIRDNIIGRDESGTELGNGWNGIFVHSGNGALIEDNLIVNNGAGSSHGSYFMPEAVSGIRLESVTSGTIQNNYVGTDASGTNAGNAFDGITLYTNSINVDITNNVSCYNGFYDFDGLTPHSDWDGNAGGGGIALRTGSGNNVDITANYVGVHRDNSPGGNHDYGISIEGGSNATIGGDDSADGNIIGNSQNSAVVGSERGCGIWLYGASNTEVSNNVIADNNGHGIQIEGTATGNVIGNTGKGNAITGNDLGILVSGSSANNNMLRFNSFSCNASGGISLEDDGNDDYGNSGSPKGVFVSGNETRASYISGYAPSASAIVDIYAPDNICPLACDDDANQGLTRVAEVTAASSVSPNGLFFWEYDFVAGGSLVDKENVTVIATEAGVAGSVNTSEFSICHLECDTPKNSVINAADFTFCPGDDVTLTANSFGMSTTDYTYNWYLGSIDPSNLVHTDDSDSTYTTDVAGTYLVVIEFIADPMTCRDTTTTGVVVADSNPNIEITSSTTGLCDGETVDLTATSTDSGLDYSWTPGGEITDEITVGTSGTFSVTVTDPSTGCSESDDILIEVTALPVVSATDVRFCQEDSVLISAGAPGMEYSWTPGGVTTESFYVYSGGDYEVTVTDPSTGCSAVDTATADQSPDPKPIVTLPADSSMCPASGDQITITGTFVSDQDGIITWSTGDNDIDSIIATDTIVYWAAFTDEYGCEGMDTMKIFGECVPPDPLFPNVTTETSPWTPIGDIEPEQVVTGDLVVYNRWGIEMYSSHDELTLPEWKGLNLREEECSAGVYYWIWEFEDNTNKVRRYNGYVQLLR